MRSSPMPSKNFDVAEKARLEAHNSLGNSLFRAEIGHAIEPSLEFLDLTNLDHM